MAEVAPQGQGGEGEAGWMGYLSKAVAYLPAQVLKIMLLLAFKNLCR